MAFSGIAQELKTLEIVNCLKPPKHVLLAVTAATSAGFGSFYLKSLYTNGAFPADCEKSCF